MLGKKSALPGLAGPWIIHKEPNEVNRQVITGIYVKYKARDSNDWFKFYAPAGVVLEHESQTGAGTAGIYLFD